MMVLFVSQCEKKAHKRTRRVLDAFADRIGDTTWRTVMTEEGLQTVHKLLRKSASKSTAVACHWLRSRSRSQLVWVVGNRDRFDSQGRVPVNVTAQPFRNTKWENNWLSAHCIQIMATLAALLHDLGKSTIGFQGKLFAGAAFTGDPYRHEWISLRLFEWLIEGAGSDEEWLRRFCSLDGYLQAQPIPFVHWQEADLRQTTLSALPPLAQWLAWLVVSHHRLPFEEGDWFQEQTRKYARRNTGQLRKNLLAFYETLTPVDHWVRNPRAVAACTEMATFWSFDGLVLHSEAWQKQLSRWARKALNHPPLMALAKSGESDNSNNSGNTTIADPLLLHSSRLALMLGDYTYSNEKPGKQKGNSKTDPLKHKQPDAAGSATELVANTCRHKGKVLVKQYLDQHLLGVAHCTAHFARLLPALAANLPTLAQHDALIKPTAVPRFSWQNKAYKLALSLRQASAEQGFFGVNMASTGCGKTIGNARIIYALADAKHGARFTIALGLRVLTLQTGASFRENLGLSDTQLAVLVGGAASRELFLWQQEDRTPDPEQEQSGSALAPLVADGDVVEGGTWEASQEFLQKQFHVVLAEDKARDLLFTPVVACTIDHLMQASECRRGGRYIVPWLRLFSSDLILDEPDDFNQEDLPALARLVHLAGLCGSRIVLSSATLTPDFVAGLFQAYQAGRFFWNKSRNLPQKPVVCAWFDEKRCQAEPCPDTAFFEEKHQHFVAQRAAFLRKEPVRRMGTILTSLPQYTEKPARFYGRLAKVLVENARSLHQAYHVVHPQSGKRLSIGLIRMANTGPLMALALALYQAQLEEACSDTHIHLCCYHSRQVLILRSELEEKLDRILKRDETHPEGIFTHPEIKQALNKSDARHHIFIVLASPVAEIGRDHDYDWAIVEPSSMRSLIQLAGRIWRHRPGLTASQPNVLVWQFNIKALIAAYSGGNAERSPVFFHPGFENKEHLLGSHDCSILFNPEQLAHISAIARIVRPGALKATERLADLEHLVMQEMMHNNGLNFVNACWHKPDSAHRASAHLQIISPFRAGRAEEEWLLVPDEDGGFNAYAAQQVYEKGLEQSNLHNKILQPFTLPHSNTHLSPWLNSGLYACLEKLQQRLPEKSIASLACRYATVQLPVHENGWYFHEWFGFWRVD
jgi:CRISPR-associated endonuclease/helicase Cas3